MNKSKRPFTKSKRSFRRRLPPIQSGDRIDYRNMSLIIYDLNESHIHLSTCYSSLRAFPKRRGFCEILDWMSCISNKLFNGWHTESYK
ncbi:hypothetical protein YC2023_053219 [Brassica napus]